MRIVITGGNRGIGKSIAFYFASKGHDIAICARNIKKLNEVKEEILKAHPESSVLVRQVDVADKLALKGFADKIIEDWNGADVLINNAGRYVQSSLMEEEDCTLETLFKTNLQSAYYLSKWLVPHMPKMQKSHIFNIGSVAGIQPMKRCAAYTVTKYAMQGFSKTLREELKQFGIRVTSVLPGAVYTDSWKDELVEKEKLMPPEDIAAIIYDCFMLSEQTVVEEIVLRPFNGDVNL